MEFFRLRGPDGEEIAIEDTVVMQLAEAALVQLTISAEKLTLKNLGAEAVVVSTRGCEKQLNLSESHEIFDSCTLYLANQKSDTQHTIERVGPEKKRRMEKKPLRQFGFDLYRLRKGRGIQEMESNLGEWFNGEISYAMLSDYMVDLVWLLSAVPSIATIPSVLIVHGEMRGDQHLHKTIDDRNLRHITLHKPPLPIPYGTYHSKMCLMKFKTGVRVVVHTANLIYTDCGNKTQGAWKQDFPPKTDDSTASEFETDLLRYLTALRLPKESKRELFEVVQGHDFSSARVKLIQSVPGCHKGQDIHRYGHMLVRQCLAKEVIGSDFDGAPIACQFSSLGSLDEKWLYEEFMVSLASGRSKERRMSLTMPSRDAKGLQLVWPTVTQVRQSIEGWGAGRSIPGPSKNVNKPFLRRHWHKFNGVPIDRGRAMPHIKTYTRYTPDSRLAWVLLASHNLSKAAWGVLQKKESQLMIRSYELGVLFLPSIERNYQLSPSKDFHCTRPSSDPTPSLTDPTFQAFSGALSNIKPSSLYFPLPFSFPPEPYGTEDDPWMVDVRQNGLDILGKKWGQWGTMYGREEVLSAPDQSV